MCAAVCLHISIGVNVNRRSLSSWTLRSRQQGPIMRNEGAGLTKSSVRVPNTNHQTASKLLVHSCGGNTLNIKHYHVKIVTAFISVPRSILTLFIAMLAAPLLGKRPIKVNLKSVCPPPPTTTIRTSTWKHFYPNCTVLKVDLLQDHQIFCSHACMSALLSYTAQIFYRLGQSRG